MFFCQKMKIGDTEGEIGYMYCFIWHRFENTGPKPQCNKHINNDIGVFRRLSHRLCKDS